MFNYLGGRKSEFSDEGNYKGNEESREYLTELH